MVRPRLRSALVVGALLAAVAPVVAQATSPALKCTGAPKGFWQTISVDAFKPVTGLSSPDTVTSYTVDEQKPQNVAVTNGVRVQTSPDHGCNWVDSLALSQFPGAGQSFAGAGAQIVQMLLLDDRRVVAVREGNGAASRPHVMVQVGNGAWTTSDSGLPLSGTPKLLRSAGDRRTLYLTVSPTGGGSDGGTTGLPGLPGLPGGGTQETGLLYASTNGGASWALRTTATDLPSGGAGFTQLDIDANSANHLYGIVNGRLVVSYDGGATFPFVSNETDFSAVTAMGPQAVIALRRSGRTYFSDTGGNRFESYPGPAGATAVGYRLGDSGIMVEVNGQFGRLNLRTGQLAPVRAPVTARDGSLMGDRGLQSSFHALAGHSLLRYVDPSTRNVPIPPIAVGDTSVPPPNVGRVIPALRNVTLKVGESSTESFQLNLPKNETPLDLVFLVDVSRSQIPYINTLKAKINSITAALERNKLSLKVGIATMGAGPKEGERGYPATWVYPPETTTSNPLGPVKVKKYNRPVLYRLIRPVGETGPRLKQAVDLIEIESDDVPGPKDPSEGALLALSEVAKGRGIQSENEFRIAPGRAYGEQVEPGNDAKFRASTSVRRVVILSTDEPFDNPYPQKRTAAGLDFSRAISDLRAERVQVIGLSSGANDALPDLRRVARETGTFAPPGGITCDNGNESGIIEFVAAGQPLVCNTADKFDQAIIKLLSSLVDRQNVQLVPLNKSPVLGALQGRALLGLDVKRANTASFQVNVTCAGVQPGRYLADVATVLRGYKVGQTRLAVTCVKAQAVVPPKPLPPVLNPPPAQPQAPPVVPPPAPPAPAAQPQVQVQTQVQVNPMNAAAAQEQQELQLALAMAGVLKDDDPVFNPGQQMAMVDRRKREQVQAMYVLAVGMVACSALGLARLRARPEVRPGRG